MESTLQHIANHFKASLPIINKQTKDNFSDSINYYFYSPLEGIMEQ